MKCLLMHRGLKEGGCRTSTLLLSLDPADPNMKLVLAGFRDLLLTTN